MKLIIVDDDPMVRDSLKIIMSTHPNYHVVALAENGEQAIKAVKTHPADLILMDISMPIMDGITATRIIKREHPDIKIVMLTTFLDFKNIHQSLQAGADGYLLKSDSVSKQKETIKMVLEGHAVISRQALEKLTSQTPESLLTPRENDVLKLVAEGLSNKEIATSLYMSEGTIRNLISLILEKLTLRDRTQLAIYYWQNKGANTP